MRFKTSECLENVLDVLFDVVDSVRSAMLRLARWCQPSEVRRRRLARQEELFRNWTNVARLQAGQEIERLSLIGEVREFREALPAIGREFREDKIKAHVRTRWAAARSKNRG